MFIKWNYGRLMPFYAPDTGADGGTSAGAGTNAEASGEGADTDFRALYEQLKADNERLAADNAKWKKAVSDTNTEIANIKREQKANMSEQQLKEAEQAEKEQRYQELQNEVYEMRVSTAFAKAGFDERDYGDIAKKIVEVGGEQSNDLAETLIAFVKKANQSAVASARNGAIKDGAVPPKTSTAQPSEQDTKSDYQLYQESKTKTNNIVNL